MAQSIYEAPATRVVVIAPHDDNDLDDVPRALWVGGTGDLEVIAEGDTVAVTLAAVPAGTLLPLRVSRVRDANTTATLILGLY